MLFNECRWWIKAERDRLVDLLVGREEDITATVRRSSGDMKVC